VPHLSPRGVGVCVGSIEGVVLGLYVVGFTLGFVVDAIGFTLGVIGEVVGSNVGETVGVVGSRDGSDEGGLVGSNVGLIEGGLNVVIEIQPGPAFEPLVIVVDEPAE
jgi:hypothetical protein